VLFSFVFRLFGPFAGSESGDIQPLFFCKTYLVPRFFSTTVAPHSFTALLRIVIVVADSVVNSRPRWLSGQAF
jgi:hypothetical protein